MEWCRVCNFYKNECSFNHSCSQCKKPMCDDCIAFDEDLNCIECKKCIIKNMRRQLESLEESVTYLRNQIRELEES